MKKIFTLNTFIALLTIFSVNAQSTLWGTGSGSSGEVIIYRTDANGGNAQQIFKPEKLKGNTPGRGPLCEAPDGQYYGITSIGGSGGQGSIFMLNSLTDEVTELMNFDTTAIGNPKIGFVKGPDNLLYGISAQIESKPGSLYRYDYVNNTVTVLHSFSSIDFFNIQTGFIISPDSVIYGTNSSGVSSNSGLLYKYDLKNSTFDILHTFTSSNSVQGINPFSKPFLASNGNLYGTTNSASLYGNGVIYEFNLTDNTYSVLHTFENVVSNGWEATVGLVEQTPGILIGVTRTGGANSFGIIYQYNLSSSTFTKLADFSNTTGIRPNGNLLIASNGRIYGTTQSGGANGNGTIYEWNPATASLVRLFDFESDFSGRNSLNELLELSTGVLYGATEEGGNGNGGTLYKITTVGDFELIYSFNGFNGGRLVNSSLIQADNDMLYTYTYQGGKQNKGVIIKVNPFNNSVSTVVDFTLSLGVNNTPQSYGDLFKASNGKLYGKGSYGGGADNYGFLFEYNPTNEQFAVVHEFTIANGYAGFSYLVEGPNQKLYGFTDQGGAQGSGQLFEFDLNTNTFITKQSLISSLTGRFAYSQPIIASNGKMYVRTYRGGPSGSDGGMIVEYDFNNNTLVGLLAIPDSLGQSSNGTNLVEWESGKFIFNTFSGIIEWDRNTNQLEVKYDYISSSDLRQFYSFLTKTQQGRIFGTSKIGSLANRGGVFEWNFENNTVSVTTAFDSLEITGVYLNSVTEVCLTNNRVTQNNQTLTADLNNATYQWINCATNTPVLGATNRSFTPEENGLYAVEVSFGGCMRKSACTEVVANSITVVNQSGVKIYPNPTETVLNIELKEVSSVQIYTITGVKIAEMSGSSAYQYNTSSLAAGLYFVKAGEQTMKFVKK